MALASDSAKDTVMEGARVDCLFDDDYFRGTVDKGTVAQTDCAVWQQCADNKKKNDVTVEIAAVDMSSRRNKNRTGYEYEYCTRILL